MKKILLIMLMFSQLSLFAKKPEGTVTSFIYTYKVEDEFHGNDGMYEVYSGKGYDKNSYNIRITRGKTKLNYIRKANPMDFITETVEKYKLYRLPKSTGDDISIEITYSNGKTFKYKGGPLPEPASAGLGAILKYIKEEAVKVGSTMPTEIFIHEGGGMARYGGYTYDLFKDKDGKMVKTIRNSGEKDEVTTPVTDPNALAGLQPIIEKYKVWEWNGDYQLNVFVTDGGSWSFNVTFDNGEEVRAHGYMHFPKGYGDAKNEFAEYIKGLK